MHLDGTPAPPLRASSPSPSLRKARSAFDLSPRLGTTDEGFFSWRRWYGATPTAPKEPAPLVPSSDEVSRLVRDALRRRREADDGDSLASSAASSQTSGASTASPASSSGTWETSASELSKAAGPLRRSSGYEQEDIEALPTLDYDTTCSSPRLRAAQSVATLKAPRMIRRVSSSASISPVPVELPPQSPHAVTSPALPLFDEDQLVAFSEPPSVTLSPRREPPTTSFRSRLASSLRKSASSITLRNPLRLSNISSSPLSPLPPPSPAPGAASAAAILRDLLLKHDSVVDPSTEPLSPLFHPTLDLLVDETGDDDGRPQSSSSDDEHGGLYSSDESHGDSDDDPFRATAPTHVAWMAPTASGARTGADDVDSVLDSPSSAFPPFDPFAFADLATAPPSPPLSFAPTRAEHAASPRAPRSRPARLITKQRSFVDPRTRQLRTAPSVCVTPSTPEKKRFGGDEGPDALQ